MEQASIFDQILDPAYRADPYPLYDELRKTPVRREADGSYVVSTYYELVALLHDPRVSSDPANRPAASLGRPPPDPEEPGVRPDAFIRRDPPEHDRVRALAVRHFGPPHTPGRIEGMRGWLAEISAGLIDNLAGKNRADIVDEFSYPLPVTAICKILGVPRQDAPLLRQWVDAAVQSGDPNSGTAQERRRRNDRARAGLGRYLNGLADAHARDPGDDLISGMLTDPSPGGPLSRAELLANLVLLLVAGHETTVNLITNGMLTLLRHPDVLDRLNREPGLATGLVEELLRYDPPVQMLPNRATLADIDIAGTTIPEHSALTLVQAAANRDPSRFANADRFDPDRTDNQHLGFGSGIHYCFGASLARAEAQVALPALASRLVNPRLAADPPPYRPSPLLRGPSHLEVVFDAVLPGRRTSPCAPIRAWSRHSS